MAKRGQGEGSIAKRPDGTWWARITLGKDENGKQKRKAFYGATRKEVQEKLTAALNEVNHGTYVEASKMTVGVWVTQWLRDYKKLSVKPTTYSRYYQSILYDIEPLLGQYKISELRPDHVQKFVNKMYEEKKYSYSSIRGSLSILRMALEQAVKNGILVRNVATDAIMPKKTHATREVLTQEEQDQFIEHVSNLYYGRFYILLLSTGLRGGEARALTWADIDFEKGILNVNKTLSYAKDPDNPNNKFAIIVSTPKTQASIRTIPLLTNIVEMLKAQKLRQLGRGIPCEDNDYVFTTCNKNPVLQVNVYGNFKKQIKKLGMNENLSIHCLRHTFATRGLENGIPLKVMQELLGHSSIKMTADLYTHVLENTKKDSIKMVENTIKLSSEEFITGEALKARVKDYINKNNISVSHFAREIGYAKSSVQSYLAGRVRIPDAIEGAVRKYFKSIESRNGE